MSCENYINHINTAYGKKKTLTLHEMVHIFTTGFQMASLFTFPRPNRCSFRTPELQDMF